MTLQHDSRLAYMSFKLKIFSKLDLHTTAAIFGNKGCWFFDKLNCYLGSLDQQVRCTSVVCVHYVRYTSAVHGPAANSTELFAKYQV